MSKSEKLEYIVIYIVWRVCKWDVLKLSLLVKSIWCYSIRLDWAYVFTGLHFLAFFFFFSCVSGSNAATVHALFINSSCKSWLFHGKQCTRALFMDLQIPLFSNFFIKNGSHDTIHTFKNYFAQCFQFQQK